MAVRPPAPVLPSLFGSIPDQMRQLAEAISRKADVTSEPVYSAVLLLAPDGTTYRVTVDDSGALSTSVVTR